METAQPAVESHEAAGARVAVMARPGEGDVALSLWIDAGSRDAEPPQLATVAAFVAADAAGPEFEARVLPDGTEIHGSCRAAEVSDRIRALSKALGTREVSTDALVTARRRLTRHRRRAAGDEGRRAHRLALRGALGTAADKFFPLGSADADERLQADAVEAFLARHYGPSRALLAVAGPVDANAVGDAAEAAFGPLPGASDRRAERPAIAPRAGVAVEVGRDGWLVAATPVHGAGHGAAVARAVLDGPLRDRIDSGRSARLDATTFQVRGGAWVLVRVGGLSDLDGAARELAFELGRVRLEVAPEHATPPPAEDPPAALTRALGEAWVVGAPPDPPADPPEAPVVGLGAIVPGGRADRPSERDPDAVLRRGARNRLAGTLREASGALAPKLRGPIHGDGASVVLGNGARIEVQRRPKHRRVALSVRIAGGAGTDPPTLHGRAALLATALAHGCRGGGDGIPTGAGPSWSLRPVVAHDAVGLVVEAPRAAWRAALDRLLGCLASPRLAVSSARTALLDALADEPPFRAWVGRAVSPGAPGLVAPWGAPTTLAHVQAGDLARLWARAREGAKLAVVVEGEVPAREVVLRAARRLARLPSGSLPATATPGPLPKNPIRTRWDGEGVAFLMAWRLPEDTSAGEGRRLARTLGGALRRVEQVEPLWSDAGRAGPLGWMAVAVQVPLQDARGFDPQLEKILSAMAAEGHETAKALMETPPIHVIGRRAH
ncbi:MAG: hypothetical protein ACODAU_12180 [Myxococcota bacterium]